MKFIHQISRGSLFNQIYIPKEAEGIFEVGDIVEVRLLKKKSRIYCPKTMKKLSEFKEKLIKEIFSSLVKFHEIKQAFIVGSFLIEKVEYNDIDLLLITAKKIEGIEEKIYNYLTDKFQLKFHIISFPESSFLNLEKICPLTRSMLYYFVSNKKFELAKEIKIDKNHLEFLLMMPEDLLKIKANSRVFYDNIRRLVTIHNFLQNKSLNPIEINKGTDVLVGDFLYSQLKNNELINEKDLAFLRKIIKKQLSEIRKKL